MKFHGIEMVGKFINQKEDAVPTWTSTDIARLLYAEDKSALYFGTSNNFTALVDCVNTQTIAGTKTFTSFPVLPSTYPTISTHAVNKKYVDDFYVSNTTITNYVTLTTNQTITGIKTFTQFPVLPDAYPSTSTQSANKKYVDYKFASLSSQPFPIGMVFLSIVSTNPNTLLGYGTWERISQGRMLVGVNESDGDFSYAGQQGGAKTHTLTTSQMPVHSHAVYDAGHSHVVVDGTHTHSVYDPSHSHSESNGTYAFGGSGDYGFSYLGPGAGNSFIPITISANYTSISLYGSYANIGVVGSYSNTSIYNAGGYDSVVHMNPYFCVYVWKRTA
jgi:hypothetical protein